MEEREREMAGRCLAGDACKSKMGHWLCHYKIARLYRLEDDTFKFIGHIRCLTNRWSQPLVVVMSTFDFVKQFRMFAALAATSGGSACSR